MKKIKELVLSKQTETIADYFSLFRLIEKEIKERKLSYDKTLKISIQSSFTINGIKEVLYVKCCELGILPEFYIGNYNQKY